MSILASFRPDGILKLLGIITAANNQVHLFASSVRGDFFQLTLVDVFSFRADDFMEGNIIFDITFVTGASVVREEVLFATGIEDDSQFKKFVDATMQRIKESELFLFQLSPSWGSTIACLCKELRVQPISIDNPIRSML